MTLSTHENTHSKNSSNDPMQSRCSSQSSNSADQISEVEGNKAASLLLCSPIATSNSRNHRRSYDRIKDIGTGSFGKAVLVQERSSGKYYVMKLIETSLLGPKERQDTLNEIRVLSSLKHPYIISYKESFIHDDGLLCIVMDYADGGDLYKTIAIQKKRVGTGFPEIQIIRWFTQATLALKYLHDKHILHRDLKSQNLFLMSNGRLRLGDFGIAKVLDGTAAFTKTQIGTPYYLSPEICKNQPYSWASDIWSLGCILYQLATLHVPFNAPNISVLIEKITRHQPPPLPDHFSSGLRCLYTDCMQRDWQKRPSATAILFKDIIQDEIKKMLSEEQEKRRLSNAKFNPSIMIPQGTPSSSQESIETVTSTTSTAADTKDHYHSTHNKDESILSRNTNELPVPSPIAEEEEHANNKCRTSLDCSRSWKPQVPSSMLHQHPTVKIQIFSDTSEFSTPPQSHDDHITIQSQAGQKSWNHHQREGSEQRLSLESSHNQDQTPEKKRPSIAEKIRSYSSPHLEYGLTNKTDESLFKEKTKCASKLLAPQPHGNQLLSSGRTRHLKPPPSIASSSLSGSHCGFSSSSWGECSFNTRSSENSSQSESVNQSINTSTATSHGGGSSYRSNDRPVDCLTPSYPLDTRSQCKKKVEPKLGEPMLYKPRVGLPENRSSTGKSFGPTVPRSQKYGRRGSLYGVTSHVHKVTLTPSSPTHDEGPIRNDDEDDSTNQHSDKPKHKPQGSKQPRQTIRNAKSSSLQSPGSFDWIKRFHKKKNIEC